MVETTPLSELRGLLAAVGLSVLAPAVAPAYEVVGFVVDEENRPVHEATVSLEGSEIAALTDSLGTFRLTGVAEGTYAISARASCALTARVTGVRVPRPVQVPLPIEVIGVDCRRPIEPGILEPGDLQELVAGALADAIAPEHRPLARALVADGAIALRSRNAALRHVHIAGSDPLPVTTPDPSSPAPPAAPLNVDLCVRVLDADHALVWIGLAPLPAPFELAVFRGDQALLTLERHAGGWVVRHALYCLSEAPPDLPRRHLPDVRDLQPRR